MDYKKKYEETLERAKSIKDSIIASHNKESASYYTGFINNIFPELKESEDERIRKAIIEAVKQSPLLYADGINKEKMFAWLEKQKLVPNNWDDADRIMSHPLYLKGFDAGREVERVVNKQKPAEWSEEEKGILLGCISALQNSSHWLLADKLSSLRPQPKQEWSEEDDKMYNKLLDDMYYSDCMNVEDFTLAFREIRDWVTERMKYLRPQPHWKPSDEQMEALNALNCHGTLSYVGQQGHLISLYNDIKKL